jgi:hypothetical protein
MTTYETVTDALQDLRGRGFTHNFNLEADALHCPELDLRLHPNTSPSTNSTASRA